MNKALLTILSYFFIFSDAAFAAPLEFKDHAIPELISNSQGLAMGNASLGDDIGGYTAFSNPAARLSARKRVFSPLNITGHFNTGTYDSTIGDQGFSLEAIREGRNLLSFLKMKEELASKGGGSLHQQFGFLSYFQLKEFTIGYFASYQSSGMMNTESSDFSGINRRDTGPYLHYANKLGQNLLVGITYTRLTRNEGSKIIYAAPTPAQEAASLDNVLKAGAMNHVIFGMKYRVPIRKSFTQVSFVARNLLNSEFTDESESGVPNKIPATFDIGLSWWRGAGLRWKYELALRDLGGEYDTEQSRKIQAGINYDLKKKFNVKVGMLDSAPTFGFGFTIGKKAYLGFSTYELDTSESEIKASDRRFVFEFSL